MPAHPAKVLETEGLPGRSRLLVTLAVLVLWAPLRGQSDLEYDRPVDVAPAESDIGDGYTLPPVQKPPPRAHWLQMADVVLLGFGMGLCAWIVLAKRSRAWLVGLTVACLIYFGFYRKGCVCPIGSIQNVVVAIVDPDYAIPIVVIAVFFLPLLVAVFFGRVFCGGVCPLGAIQELVLLKPVQVPARLDRWLGWLKYVYLLLAIWFAALPAPQRDFVICRFDPFVSLFRRTGFAHMLFIGAGFLLLGVFIGRPYCRYLCPYGGLLSLCSRLAPRGVSITPDKELDCGLCAEACPYGAIEKMRAVRSACLYCSRCYAYCPREGKLAQDKTAPTATEPVRYP